MKGHPGQGVSNSMCKVWRGGRAECVEGSLSISNTGT